jgi:hypothetical protein
MKRVFLIMSFLLSVCVGAQAQQEKKQGSGGIEGYIVCSESPANQSQPPVKDARVAIIDQSGNTIGTTRTSYRGIYYVRVPSGKYRVKVSASGYKTQKSFLAIVSDEKTKEVSMALDPKQRGKCR